MNGATELLPGSHLWGEEAFPGSLTLEDFANKELRAAGDDPACRADAIKAIMPAGSLMVAKGTLWHRGGANNSDKARLIILETAFQVACADGMVEAQEQEQLHAIARALGINEGVVQLEINAFERAHHRGET